MSASPESPRTVAVEDVGAVRVIRIVRPEVRNAVDRSTAAALFAAFEAFEVSDAAVAVLSGAGGNFCAGADLKAFAAGDGNRLESSGPGPMGPSRMRLSKPVIAAIEGFAVAGGLELALWCDLRVAASDATLGVFCRRWGVPLIDGGTVRLPRLIGLSRALDLILTGRAVDAAEALDFGLVNRVVAPGSAESAAVALGRDIAGFPAGCMLADRASAYESCGSEFGAAMAREFAGASAVLGEAESGARRFAGGAGRGGSWTPPDE